MDKKEHLLNEVIKTMIFIIEESTTSNLCFDSMLDMTHSWE